MVDHHRHIFVIELRAERWHRGGIRHIADRFAAESVQDRRGVRRCTMGFGGAQ